MKKQNVTQNEQTETGNKRGRRNEVIGEVISNKMNKTIAVQIFRRVQHARYGKFIRRSTVFKAHDEKNVAKEGDIVRIFETRPLSKTKRWVLIEVVKKSEVAGLPKVESQTP